MSHPYLPITATSPRRPPSFVPKVPVVERFDYMYSFKIIATLKQAAIDVKFPSSFVCSTAKWNSIFKNFQNEDNLGR